MKFSDLQPRFVKDLGKGTFQELPVSAQPSEADGVLFLCPVCYETNKGEVGTHSVLLWKPEARKDLDVGSGRWKMIGTSVLDLTLDASVQIASANESTCGAHFHVRNGEVIECK